MSVSSIDFSNWSILTTICWQAHKNLISAVVMKSSKRFVILLAGDLSVDDRINALCHSARVIAADSGISHAKALGVTPELWVGDFDSSPPELVEHYNHVEKLTFERQKDETDGSLAIKAALERGADEIVLLGPTGGTRFDHSLGILFEMLAWHEQGVQVFASTGDEEYWPIVDERVELELPKGCLFSILGLTPLRGLTIEGAKYPLQNIDVEFGSTHTLSNVVERNLNINITSGRAIIIARPKDFSGI